VARALAAATAFGASRRNAPQRAAVAHTQLCKTCSQRPDYCRLAFNALTKLLPLNMEEGRYQEHAPRSVFRRGKCESLRLL